MSNKTLVLGAGELGRAVAGVADSAQLSPNIFTQIALEMQSEVSSRVTDSWDRLPEGLAVGEGVDFLKKAGKVAPEKGSQFG